MKAQIINDKSWKSYNNEPLRDGEILVPQLVSHEYAIARGADPANLRTWTKSGVRFLVMFVPVPVAQEKICRQEFNSEVNELLDERLGPNRRSRCLIPQPDGSVKTCPKRKNGNHAPCAACPYRGVYEKEDRSVVSLDELDQDAYHALWNRGLLDYWCIHRTKKTNINAIMDFLERSKNLELSID